MKHAYQLCQIVCRVRLSPLHSHNAGAYSCVHVACTDIDISGKRATFISSTGALHQDYDLLVGADGVGSAVRAALQQHYPDMRVVVSDSGREYKTYTGVRGDIEPDEFKVDPGATLHLYTSDDPWTTFTAHSNPDGTYSGTLSLKTGAQEY